MSSHAITINFHTLDPLDEPYAVCDAEKRIAYCNKAFGDLALGVPLARGMDGEAFFAPATGEGNGKLDNFFPAFSQRVFSESASSAFPVELPGTDTLVWYMVWRLNITVGGTPHTLLCLKNCTELGLFDEEARVACKGYETLVYEQVEELKRLNASLRIENAERNAVSQALRRAESRYRDIFDNALEGIFQWTPEGHLLSANRACAHMLGYQTVNDLLDHTANGDFNFCHIPPVCGQLMEDLEAKGSVTNFEFELRGANSAPLWVNLNARRVLDINGKTSYYEGFIENISSRRNAKRKLEYQAFHDPLTDLANRALFNDRLQMALRRSARQPEYSFSVLFLDLNRFKMVNDMYGHAVGDAVLRHAAETILSCVREHDTVSRFGGDEFGIIIEGFEHADLALQVAERVHIALSRPFTFSGQEIRIGASIGIVLHAERYDAGDDILRDADTAMYKAKADPASYYRVFSPQLRAETLESVQLEMDLRAAETNNEFFMQYQPIVNLSSTEPYSFECLVRWRRRGEIVPSRVFFPVAEDTGLIERIGVVALRMMCGQAAQWARLSCRKIILHSRISLRQLGTVRLLQEVRDVLNSTGVSAHDLRLEVYEMDPFIARNNSSIFSSLQQLSAMGVRLCYGNFGAGLSSLSLLRQLPLDSIKVAKELVAEIETNPRSLPILHGILTLGQALGLAVIVPGINTPRQFSLLQSLGYCYGQGDMFAHPLTTEEATAYFLK